MCRFPADEELLTFTVQTTWAPLKRFDAVNEQLEIYMKNLDASQHDRIVCLCAEKCELADWSDGAVQLYEHWIDRCSQIEVS